MKYRSFFGRALIIAVVANISNLAIASDPVNPKTTPEATALLDLIYRISGKYTLTGQHNYPDTRDRNSRFAAKYTGQSPAIRSTDMGFAKDGDKDSYLARPDIVKEAIRQHKKGSIITMCWHAVPPTAKEPVASGEVGNPPAIDIIKKQPKWAYWVIWADMVRNLSVKKHHELVSNQRILSQEDTAYWQVMAPFRKACGLPLLPLKSKYTANFSGIWKFNEAKSELGNSGPANVPYEMKIDQDDDLIHVNKYTTVEYGDDQLTNDDISLDGTEMKSRIFNIPRVSKASWDAVSNSIKISSTVKFDREGRSIEMKSSEEWSLLEKGKILKIVQVSTGFRGEEINVSLIFSRSSE